MTVHLDTPETLTFPDTGETRTVPAGDLRLPPNTAVQYKYIKKNPDGSVTWESDPNRSFTTPASGAATRNESWR